MELIEARWRAQCLATADIEVTVLLSFEFCNLHRAYCVGDPGLLNVGKEISSLDKNLEALGMPVHIQSTD